MGGVYLPCFSLAVADLLVAILVMPLGAVKEVIAPAPAPFLAHPPTLLLPGDQEVDHGPLPV